MDSAPVLLATLGLVLLFYATGKPANLIIDGQTMTYRTHASNVAGMLDEIGLFVGPNDRLYPGASTQLSWETGSIPTIQVSSARPVIVESEAGSVLLETPETDPGNLASLAGMNLYPGDRLSIDGIPELVTSATPSHIKVDRSVQIRLTIDGVERTLHSAASSLGEALWESGIPIYAGDQLVPAAHTPLSSPIQAALSRSRDLLIEVGPVDLRSRSAAQTVGEALAESGVHLVGLDYSRPGAEAPLPADGAIRVVRVREEVQMDQIPLPFETSYEPVHTLEIDNQNLVQAGAFGVLTNRLRVRKEDGAEVSRTVEGEWVAQEATPQIIGYGTQIQIRNVVTDDGSLDYWRAVEMYATSYSPSNAGIPADHPWYGITASGKRLKKGLVAIDRSLIPFGTMMYVPGYGFAEAADTGGGVKGRWIDLGYEDDEYVPWSGYVTVYFLAPVPAPESIVYIFP